jgi:hypothetical protein
MGGPEYALINVADQGGMLAGKTRTELSFVNRLLLGRRKRHRLV